MREYILDYIGSDKRKASDLYALKKLIQHQNLQKIMDKYGELYSVDLFGETIEGHRNMNPLNPCEVEIIGNSHVEADRTYLSKVKTIEGFDNLDGKE